MKCVVQRVKQASVRVDKKKIGEIGAGQMVLVGIGKEDSEETVQKRADKLVHLRIMADDNDRMNRSILDTNGEMLLVSQFTLYGETSGRRPGFSAAMEPAKAKELFELLVKTVREFGINAQTGEFGGYMHVSLVNDGPTTLILQTD